MTSRLPEATRIDEFTPVDSECKKTSKLSLHTNMENVEPPSLEIQLLTDAFLNLPRLDPKETFFDAVHVENQSKNRYASVLPYDKTRVVLNKPSDYVNASWVTVHTKDLGARKYIAAQAPLEHTVEDFWYMIWQEQVPTVIMLTETVDKKGNEKCFQYWTDDEMETVKIWNPNTRDHVEINQISTEDNDAFVSRVFDMVCRSSGQKFNVRHLHFKAWPDMGVPCPDSFINFYEHVNSRCKDDKAVVHCSAGIGRTGTYILIDTLIKSKENEKSVDPLDIVANLRKHRMEMVETEQQFLFACEIANKYPVIKEKRDNF